MTRTGRDFFLRLNAAEILDKPNLNMFKKDNIEPPTTSATARELRPGGRLPPLRAQQQTSATARPDDNTQQQQREATAYEEAVTRKKERRRKRKEALRAKRAQRQRE